MLLPDSLIRLLERLPEQLKVVGTGESYTGYIRINYSSGGITNINVEHSIKPNGGETGVIAKA